ncbi:transporter substrate-binding domain-containing protein [Bradyrhizobium sp. CB2312]|uniref:substrate-binding periplasmic protein n=1 Tax=Bradyrhizobium sp. CB2312 TaxID=3039155 RepID=UPI0024B1F9CA|nr:transporter substrate-binding domain-containing protein [Bradyrhizobium sp. CB2312]WFU73385.1 transporter substrate-binding domain-containing protein [Bradyrhizobium sp. CB2312]
MADPLRLVTYPLPGYTELGDGEAPGFSVEVLTRVFAAMGQEVSFEEFPLSRGWEMVVRGERDGLFVTLRLSQRAQACSFADEPLRRERWVLFGRSADVRNLKFYTLDDLDGKNVAITRGLYAWPELQKFKRKHPDMVETTDTGMLFRMLAAGRFDYGIANLTVGARQIKKMGLFDIEPILSPSVMEDDYQVCFNKARVPSSLVEAFSRALRLFKQTQAFQAISRKYFP